MYDLLLKSLKLFRRYGIDVYFVTLTSSSMFVDVDVLVSRFYKLVDRIREDNVSAEWFAVITLEGNGVIHLLTVNVSLNRQDFEDIWSEIHNSNVVRRSKVRNDFDVSEYFASQSDIVYVDCSEGFYSKPLSNIRKIIWSSENCSVKFNPSKPICRDCFAYDRCFKKHVADIGDSVNYTLDKFY